MIGKVVGRLALAGAACVAYGALIEARDFRVRRFTLPVLPAKAPQLRVLHVSDIHLLPRNKARREFLSTLAGLEPDLVVNTGDNIASAAALGPLLDGFGRLLDVPGVFVFGSNDYSAPSPINPLGYLARATTRENAHEDEFLPTEELRAGLSAGGWQDLTERRTTMELLGVRLEFRGTDDAHHNRDDYSRVAGPAAPETDVSIGVTHAPYLRLLDAMTADGVDLILAGHTHGGQVCVPGYGALTTNCDLDTSRAKGVSRHDAAGRSSWLHVSAGLGMSPYAPYRFACPPEVSLLTLLPRPEA